MNGTELAAFWSTEDLTEVPQSELMAGYLTIYENYVGEWEQVWSSDTATLAYCLDDEVTQYRAILERVGYDKQSEVIVNWDGEGSLRAWILPEERRII